MKTTYALVGIGFIILIGALIYLMSETPVQIGSESSDTTMQLTSTAFENGGSIPSKYTCDAENISPPLSIAHIPKGTASLAIVMDDPDVPKQLIASGIFDHWVVYAIDPTSSSFPEGNVDGVVGLNGSGKPGYVGPCPPPQYEPSQHRYTFTVYALSANPTFVTAPSKSELLEAIKPNIIQEASLMGVYKRISN